MSTGAAFQLVMQSEFIEKNAEYFVFTIPAWSMSSKSIQHSVLKEFDEILVVEDHLLDGGFCSWMLESSILCDNDCNIKSIALDRKVCGTVGSQDTLNLYGGLVLSNKT